MPSSKFATPKVDVVPPEVANELQAQCDELVESHILDASGELDCPTEGIIFCFVRQHSFLVFRGWFRLESVPKHWLERG